MDSEDFFHLLGILLDNSKPFHKIKEEAIEYARKRDVERSVVMTVAGAANCRLDYESKGDGGMWTVFEETKNEGRIEGWSEGRIEGWSEGRNEGRIRGIIEMGFEFGLSEEDIMEKLQHKLNVSRQKAQEYLERFAVETV